MFFYASKLLMFLIQPLHWILALLLAGIILRQKKYSFKLLLSALLLTIVLTNPLIVDSACNLWEYDRVTYKELGHYDVGIVLGGFTRTTAKPNDRVHFQKGVDRILHAIELYKMGKIDKILISGGTSRIIGEKKKEAENLLPFLIQLGIPKSDIVIEKESRNTHENALFSKEILKDYPGKYLLITSAFHMKRAKACFDKVKVSTDAFPTDYYGQEFNWSPNNIIVPRATSFTYWSILIKEWIGIVSYKIAGYV